MIQKWLFSNDWGFGGIAGNDEPSDETQRFTGHEPDFHLDDNQSDDLDYMHARYCSPHLRRFLSVDPARSAQPNVPQSWNRYAYALNNPVKFVDPDGRESRLALIFEQDVRRVLDGELTTQEFQERNAARASGAIAAGSLFVPGPEDAAIAALGATRLGKAIGSAFGVVGKSVSRILNKTGGVGGKTVDAVLKGATPGRTTKGRTKQFEKTGGFDQAAKDFNSLGPSDVKDIPGGRRVGKLADGRTVVVRPASKGGAPTLEIQAGNRRIKIRFKE